MIWPIFTPNRSIIQTMEVVEIPIFLTALEVWSKSTNPPDSKELFTTTFANIRDWIIMAKEGNLIPPVRKKKMIFFPKVKITGVEDSIGKKIIFTNIKTHWTQDWADLNYFRKSCSRRLGKDSSKIRLLMTNLRTRAYFRRVSRYQPKNQLPQLKISWNLNPISMRELSIIWIALLPQTTENTIRQKNPKITIWSSKPIEKMKFCLK